MNHVIQGHISFEKIKELIPKSPGIYEIWTNSGIGLKVGISEDIQKRLKAHAASRKSGLKQKPNTDSKNLKPSDLVSKKSVLAKHLYFDKSIVSQIACRKDYDLTIEEGRRAFLSDCCYITFELTASKAEARSKEILREKTGEFLYVGEVENR